MYFRGLNESRWILRVYLNSCYGWHMESRTRARSHHCLSRRHKLWPITIQWTIPLEFVPDRNHINLSPFTNEFRGEGHLWLISYESLFFSGATNMVTFTCTSKSMSILAVGTACWYDSLTMESIAWTTLRVSLRDLYDLVCGGIYSTCDF